MEVLTPRRPPSAREDNVTSLLALFVGSGLLLTALSVPLILRMVAPNPLYGFRVKRTLEDPAVWYAVNAFSAWGLLCVGLATCAAAVALYLVPGIDLLAYALSVAAVTSVGLAVCLVMSFRYLAALTAGQGKS
jgi:hypothetical protein